MIAVIDFGMGNLHSVTKAIEAAGGKPRLVRDPKGLADAERLVLPGVGAFRDCIAALRRTRLDEAIVRAIEDGVPFLGICLGMQVLMDESLEFGHHRGLGLIKGKVVPLPEHFPEKGFKIPHMGWNDVLKPEHVGRHPVLDPIYGRQAYFVHSYVCQPEDQKDVLALCEYGGVFFAAAIGRANVVGVQFHPEKSQAAGLAMISAFLKWRPSAP